MPERVTRSVALSGQISATPLVDVLSTVGSSGKSAEVRVQTEFGVCWIWFEDGQLVDASFNDQRGEEAVARLAGVAEGRFEVEYCKVARERVIHATVQRIFQDCANRRRLWRELVKQPPQLKAVLGVVAKWRHDGERIIPESHKGLLELFDGQNTVLDAIEKLGQEAVRTLAIIHHLYEVGVLTVLRVDEDSPASSSFPPPAFPAARTSAPASADVVWSIRPEPAKSLPGQPQESPQPAMAGAWVLAPARISSTAPAGISSVCGSSKPDEVEEGESLLLPASATLEGPLTPAVSAPATLKGPPLVAPVAAPATLKGPPIVAPVVASATLKGPPQWAGASSPPTLKGPPLAGVSTPQGVQRRQSPTAAGSAASAPAASTLAKARVSQLPPRPGPRQPAREELRSLTPPSLPLPVGGPGIGAGPELSGQRTSLSPEQSGEPSPGDMPNTTARVAKAEDTAASPTATVSNGRLLGRYEVLCRLGRGGMGTVYLCRTRGELGFRRLHALKVLRQRVDRDTEAERLFLHEAYVASRLHHPNVVAVVDAAVHGAQPYIIMDYVEGCSLQTLMSRGSERRSPAVVLSVIMDALAGLHAAHTMTDEEGSRIGLVHCDVSPENLLVGVEGTCRLSDFGVARARNLPGARNLSGSARGKARYASPEQARGMPLDARSDVFSMGVVLHEALTGVPLFLGATMEESLQRVLRQPIPPPSQVGLCPPPELDAICLRALERDPSQRFASAAAMLVELRRAAVQCGLLASPEDVGQWVRTIAQPELEMQRLASLDASQRARFEGAHGQVPPLPRALSIPPPAEGDPFGSERLESVPVGAEPSDSGGTIVLPHPAKFRNALLILASIAAIGAIAVSVLFPEVVGRWFRLDVGEPPPGSEEGERAATSGVENPVTEGAATAERARPAVQQADLTRGAPHPSASGAHATPRGATP